MDMYRVQLVRWKNYMKGMKNYEKSIVAVRVPVYDSHDTSNGGVG